MTVSSQEIRGCAELLINTNCHTLGPNSSRVRSDAIAKESHRGPELENTQQGSAVGEMVMPLVNTEGISTVATLVEEFEFEILLLLCFVCFLLSLRESNLAPSTSHHVLPVEFSLFRRLIPLFPSHLFPETLL